MYRILAFFFCILLLNLLTGCCEYKLVRGICDECRNTRIISLPDTLKVTHNNRKVLLFQFDSSFSVFTLEQEIFRLQSDLAKRYPANEANKQLILCFKDAATSLPGDNEHVIDMRRCGYDEMLKFYMIYLIEEGKAVVVNNISREYEKRGILSVYIESGNGAKQFFVGHCLLFDSYRVSCTPTGY